MRNEQSSSNNKIKNQFQLKYQQNQIQGQCLLQQITPVKKNIPIFILWCIICICGVGIPYMLTHWYPWLKRKIYYRPCTLQQATQLHIINYDQVSSYPDKQQKQFYFSINKKQKIVFFENRFMKYYIQNGQTVKAIKFDIIERVNQIMSSSNPSQLGYNTNNDFPNLLSSYGQGVMRIPKPSVFVLFIQQVMRPLYLFIFFAAGLWYQQGYIYFSSIILGSGLLAIFITLFQTFQNNKKMHKMAYHQQSINTLRNGQIVQLSSTLLVPGDIVFLKEQIKIPFDGILLQNQALINECALTGQSVPILKKPDSTGQFKTSYIYEGTNLLQINNKKKTIKFQKYRQKYGIPVVVARTNFCTTKGQLVRVISFPKQRQNVFQKQSAKFLCFLFILSIISYGILIARLQDIVSAGDLFKKFLDLISITVPPGLPVSMTVGIVFSIQKMKKKKIFCSSPNKVVVGGMTNWLCFDKTGTLTQDFMDFYCLILKNSQTNTQFGQPIYNQKQQLQADTLTATNTNSQTQNQIPKQKKYKNKINKYIDNVPLLNSALCNMAMNHTISKLQKTQQNIGDPMQVKLFQFGQFQFSDQNLDNHEILMSFSSQRGHKGAVYRRYDFDSQLFRMSAIGTSSTGNDEQFKLYIKGSPQHILGCFNKNSISPDYNKILKQYASQGYRVLAIGSKKININDLNLSRLQLQKDIDFQGFQVFENRLKPQTQGAIKQLTQAQLPCVMITGDNPQTASNISYQCGISNPKQKIMICNYSQQNKQIQFQQFTFKVQHGVQIPQYKQRKITKFQHKQSTSGDSSTFIIKINPQNGSNINNEENPNQKDKNKVLQILKDQNIQLCITGPALNHIFNLQNKKLSQQQIHILQRTTVFARAKPNDKIKAITLYQNMDKKVAMCGDGANDCGALKQADIGLSLSMAEASISAPFTSQITNISSMVQLLKQCRAGLATNFSLFNIMSIYSLIQYTTAVMTQFFYAYPGDFQQLYWDLFCNFFFFVTIGYTGTADKLTKDIPKASLFTVGNMTQVLMMFGLEAMGQFLMLYGLTQPFAQGVGWHYDITKQMYLQQGDFVTTSYQNNVLFLFANMAYVSTLVSFSVSKPWRKQFWTNPWFMLVFLIIFPYNIVMLACPGARLSLFDIQFLNYQPLNWYIFYVSIAVCITIYVMQKFILQPLFNHLSNKYPEKKWL